MTGSRNANRGKLRVRMKPSEIIKEIDKLELTEKLKLVEDIWDSIARSNSILPMPEWQKIELEKRHNDYKCGYLKIHDWNEVHEGLRKNKVRNNYIFCV